MRSPEADARSQASESPIVLATLYAPTFTVRAASEPVEITDEDGDGPYLYDARLTGAQSFDREVDLFSMERGEVGRVRVQMVLPEDLAGSASMEMQGQYLTASRCEIALIWPGQTWRERDVIIGRGTIGGLRLGIKGEPIEFVTEALAPKSGARVGDASRVMPVVLGFTPVRGKQYPTIIGRCYRLPGIKNGSLLLAGHHFADATLPTTYEDGSETAYVSWGSPALNNATEADGNPACRITPGTDGVNSDFSTETYSPGASRGLGAFTFDAANGGVQAVSGSGAAVGADGVIEWLLATSGEKIDFVQMRRTLQLLKGLDIGVYVDRETDTLRILRDRVLPFLPLIEEQGEGGLWLRYTDIASQPAEIDLVEGVNLVGRLGGLEQVSDGDDIYNRVTINYFYDHGVARYAKTYTVDATNHPLCAISKQLYGERVAPTISCPIVWADRTAASIAWDRMSRLALPRFASAWVADPSLYWLKEGSIVNLTSASLGLTQRRAAIRKASATQNPLTFVIEPVPGTLVPRTI